ncbi:hypothetical protein EDC04DRAFT_2608195 [Pisolithus marmoratus]|nr:hypothetical protein EDC04DRAFT_2608195 [Pisolithus marmoratus]
MPGEHPGWVDLSSEQYRGYSKFVHENNILVHLDGAQLWHATAMTNIAMSELCVPFNSISLCFSKGLGAPMGYLPGWVKSIHSERICLAVLSAPKHVIGKLRPPAILASILAEQDATRTISAHLQSLI